MVFIYSIVFLSTAMVYSQQIRSSPFVQVQAGTFILGNSNIKDIYGSSFCFNYSGTVGIKAGSSFTFFARYASVTKSYSGQMESFIYFTNGNPPIPEYKQGNASYSQKNLYFGLTYKILRINNFTLSAMGGLGTVALKEKRTAGSQRLTIETNSDGLGGYFLGLSSEYSLPVRRLVITGEIQYDKMPGFDNSFFDLGGVAINAGLRFYFREIDE